MNNMEPEGICDVQMVNDGEASPPQSLRIRNCERSEHHSLRVKTGNKQIQTKTSKPVGFGWPIKCHIPSSFLHQQF